MVTHFEIQTEKFQGPIEVLLSMIERRKLPINDISLALITDEYLGYMRNLSAQSLSDTTHFIYIASTLTLIKSKSLLPTIDLTDEEEGDIEQLKRRLALYQHFQKGAVDIKKKWGRRRYRLARPTPREVVFLPDESMTSNSLAESLATVLNEIPQAQVADKKPAYVKIAVHIDEIMQSLEERIQASSNLDFQAFINHAAKDSDNPKEVKVYAVVGFLAMLEIIRNGVADVLQQSNFESITLEPINHD